MKAAVEEDAGDAGRSGESLEGGPGDGPRAFPWNAVLHVGLHLLRLSPQEFWALTPVEFFIMSGGARSRDEGIGRDGLEGLMRVFPDGV